MRVVCVCVYAQVCMFVCVYMYELSSDIKHEIKIYLKLSGYDYPVNDYNRCSTS